jgi:membrane-anchored glycerophosphoryl diester phosphodiesterase (GDPDase)
LGNLSNLSFAVGARIDLQESFETVKERREMKLLQAIFLIGVIASLLTLGAMPGARLTFYSPTGEVIGSGSLSAFNLSELLTYGVFAISFAIVLFLILNFIYENIAKKYINR